MSRLKAWLTQPDQYEWITTFLHQRGMLRSARIIMVIVAGSSALVPLSVLPGQGQASAVEMITGGVTATFIVGLTVLWLTRWPTRRQSQAAVLIGAVCVSAWSLAQPTGSLAALACTAMAVTGGYIAFFHSPKLLLVNGALAAAVTAAAVLRLLDEATAVTTASVFWIETFLNVSVPLGIWGMSRAMGTYALRSEEDALTGLLNRRAFTDAVSNRLANPPAAHTHLAVVMLDLDNFKRINDTHGHLAGDRALRDVAELLREHTPAEAVICRAGGEEFLVALTAATSDIRRVTAQFCAALAGLIPKITASIGTATAELHQLTGPVVACAVDELIMIADSAMYAAKRRGGNQVHHGVRA
jgi:diguanylate cyclase (GGDEF)-like protein